MLLLSKIKGKIQPLENEVSRKGGRERDVAVCVTDVGFASVQN